MTCCAEKREFFFFWRASCLQLGELGWGRKRRNRGGEGRQSGDILTFVDGFTDGIISSVILSAILTVNRARHHTKLPFWNPRWFRRHFKQWIGHVTIRSCNFESLSDSVGKNHPRKPSHQRTAFFFNFEHFIHNFVGNYRPNVYVGIYRQNDEQTKFHQ